MTLLGPTVGELLEFCDNKFSLKTVLQIWIQMITRFEVLHDSGFLHRNVRPDCISIGQGKKASIFYLTDFVLVKRFMCPNTGQHLKHLPNIGVVGTRRYLSLNANVGNQLSRADDLIALGHVMIALLKRNRLPWDMPELPKLIIDSKDPLIY